MTALARESRFERWRGTIGLLVAPAAGLLVWSLPFPGLAPEAHRLAAIAVAVVVFWITEAIPLPVTALLGAALTVVVGVAPAKDVLGSFGHPVLFLFIGSFMLAKAMAVHGVDRRIAYAFLAHSWVGASTHRTLWALGLVAWFLSMWLSNTATVAMLFPVTLAISRTTSELAQTEHPQPRYTTALLLMLAFGSSIGGLSTPVGTPPNLIGIALIETALGIRIGFLQWMLLAAPAAAVLLAILFGILVTLFPPEIRAVPGQQVRMRAARKALGPWTAGQRNSLIAFGTAIVLWLAPGLAGLLLGSQHPLPPLLDERLPEGIVALLAACLLFVLPTQWSRREFTIRWQDAVRIDWGTVLLFGGGIALGKMMFDTGLAAALGQGLLAGLGVEGPAGLAGAAALTAALISETASNTASANMVVPVMLALSQSSAVPGLGLGIAATLGSSMGFMLPVSTPPNAIVYGSGAVRITDMIRAGLLLDAIGVLVVWATAVWWAPLVFGMLP